MTELKSVAFPGCSGDNEAAIAAATVLSTAPGGHQEGRRRRDMSMPGASFVVKLIKIHRIVSTRVVSGDGIIQFLLNRN